MGCILAQLLLGKSVLSGISTLNKLGRVVDLIERPAADDIEAIECPLTATMLE